MGFDEFGSKSQENRALLRSTVDKYFRNPKGVATNEKTDLTPSQRKSADLSRTRAVRLIYIWFILILISLTIEALILS